MVNESLFNRVTNRLLEQPEHFDIFFWFKGPDGTACSQNNRFELGDDWSVEDARKLREELSRKDCGTTACIAGLTIVMATDDELVNAIEEVRERYHAGILEVPELAAALLRIPVGVDYNELFVLERWPKDLNYYYHAANRNGDHAAKAIEAVRAIKRFLKKYKTPSQKLTLTS